MTTRKPLTHSRQAETAKPEAKPYKLKVDTGLFLEVMPTGSKRWRFRYQFAGKEQMISFGLFPDVGLLDAKERREAARKMLAQGMNPSIKRRAERAAQKAAAANSFESIAREWLDRQTDQTENTRSKSAWLLDFAIAEFGTVPVHEVTPPMVLAACRKQEAEGKHETAQRLRSKCSQVFRYAVSTGRAQLDPTRDLRGALKPVKVKHRAAITDPTRLASLLRDIDNYTGHLSTVCALKLAPLVFVRPGELRAARWADIDFEQGTWAYTPPKTRNQTQVEHIVPLPTQAIAILKETHRVTGRGTYVFRGSGESGYLSEAAILSALRRMGYGKDDMSGHGFRATARTILEEVLGFRIELIEQQLAHKVADMHGRAYNRTKHLPERRKMMQAWADYLDQLKEQ